LTASSWLSIFASLHINAHKMGTKSEQLSVLKEEEKLLLTFRSRINDQLNRLKVEELSILSMMRKAQEEQFAREEVNLDEIDNDTDEDTDIGDDSMVPDIGHLTTMTGGFRGEGSASGMMGGIFRAADDDDRMTTMEVDLGDFEGGDGAAFGALDFGDGVLGGSTAGHGALRSQIGTNGDSDLVPLNLGFETRTKIENEEEEEEEDD